LTPRRACPDDAARVRDLTRAAYAKWVALIGREPFPMKVDYDRAVRDHVVDLHEEDGELIALVEMIRHGDHLLVENLAVRPDRHGRGLGDALLSHAESVARTFGYAEIRLDTNAAFASNIAFYGRRGFTEFAREPIEEGGELVCMKKVLG
jgi:GNAT superfamily N-acetyltransferase